MVLTPIDQPISTHASMPGVVHHRDGVLGEGVDADVLGVDRTLGAAGARGGSRRSPGHRSRGRAAPASCRGWCRARCTAARSGRRRRWSTPAARCRHRWSRCSSAAPARRRPRARHEGAERQQRTCRGLCPSESPFERIGGSEVTGGTSSIGGMATRSMTRTSAEPGRWERGRCGAGSASSAGEHGVHVLLRLVPFSSAGGQGRGGHHRVAAGRLLAGLRPARAGQRPEQRSDELVHGDLPLPERVPAGGPRAALSPRCAAQR